MNRPLALFTCGIIGFGIPACEVPIEEETEAADPAAQTVTSGWRRDDVGHPGGESLSSLANGVHTITASGTDIFGNADEFHFVNLKMSGNATLVARVTQLQNSHDFAKAAVMIREDLTAGSKYVATLVTPKASNNYRRQVRSATNGITTSTKASVASAIPSYLRVTRSGNNFTTAYSTNGTTWKTIGSTVSVPMATTVHVGLAVVSHSDLKWTTAKFDKVNVTGTILVCTPNERSCDGNVARVCNAAGTGWQSQQTCPAVCSAGACTTICTPNETRCSGTGEQRCNADGSAWSPVTCSSACGGRLCGTTCHQSAIMYCVVDSELPDITTGCDLIGAGAYGCQGNRTGEPCDRASQLYLYEYQLGDHDRYYKILHYYVCDVDGHWYEGS